MSIQMKRASPEDYAPMTAIFNSCCGKFHYQEFEQSVDERRLWVERLQGLGYPVLVAIRDQKIIGFGGLAPFHPANGYRSTATSALYVHEDHRRSGVGLILAQELLRHATAMDLHVIVNAVNTENFPSIEMQKKLGFMEVGVFQQIAYVGGRWRDDLGMQLVLNPTAHTREL